MRFLAFITGSGLVTAGAWLAWPPAGLMVSGAAVLVLACYGRTHDSGNQQTQ